MGKGWVSYINEKVAGGRGRHLIRGKKLKRETPALEKRS